MPLDLLKRSEKGGGLTNAEGDANLTAIETFINAILAGTAGYEAGNALKLGGTLASAVVPTYGTWTPAFTVDSGLSGTWTYTTQTGVWVKIGGRCIAAFDIVCSAKPAAGQIVCISLPFTTSRVASVKGFISECGGITFTGMNLGAGATQIALMRYNSAYAALALFGSGRAYSDTIAVSALASAHSLSGYLIFDL